MVSLPSNNCHESLISNTITCPTCLGEGTVPKEQEKNLVALIPLNDKRLAPRRTVLYVAITVAICLLLGGTLTFFLFPRDISLHSSHPILKPTYRFVDTKHKLVRLSFWNYFNISNQNFFPLYVKSFHMSTMYTHQQVGSAINYSLITIPLKSTYLYAIQTNVTFDRSTGTGNVAYFCNQENVFLLLPFQIIGKMTCFGREQQVTLSPYQYVSCGSDMNSDKYPEQIPNQSPS